MESEKINAIPVALSVLSVVIIELLAKYLPFSPLETTALARLADIALILLIFYHFSGGIDELGLSKRSAFHGIKQGVLWSAVFGISALCIGGALILSGFNPLKFIRMSLPDHLIEFYVVGGFIGPVAEEIFFRGVVYGYLRKNHLSGYGRWGILIAIILSTGVFVAAHSRAGIPLPQVVGGIVFCISYEVEKSLLTPIIIHSLGNMALFSLSLM